MVIRSAKSCKSNRKHEANTLGCERKAVLQEGRHRKIRQQPCLKLMKPWLANENLQSLE